MEKLVWIGWWNPYFVRAESFVLITVCYDWQMKGTGDKVSPDACSKIVKASLTRQYIIIDENMRPQFDK